MGNKIIGIFLLFVVACTSQPQTGTVTEKDGTITIKVDLESVKDGHLTDYFEPEIEYLLLKEKENPDSQIGEIAKLIGYKDKIFVFDWWIGKSVQIFDRQGDFIRRIRNVGDGPGKYIELADVQVVQDTMYLLAHPKKIIKFDLEGNFINEIKISVMGRTFFYDTESSLFFIYSGSRAENLVTVLDHSGKVIRSYFSSHPDVFYGNMGDPVNFYQEDNSFYFARTYADTLYRFTPDGFKPKIIFDFGNEAMNHGKLKEKQKKMDDDAFRKYFKENSGNSYSPYGFSNTKYILSRIRIGEKSAVSIFDKQNKTHDLVNFDLINDIDESFNFYPPIYQLEDNEVAVAYRGVSLYNKAVEKKQSMSEEDWKTYQEGKGKDFIEAAFYGKETENYVLMILKTKN
ncbi:6-bladed beta-propeller [Mongoliibacter ruber]|uniref:6-bladed beta-propeller protein n=1 Tax=Mongoliibacter ruber TaxID=1750599 RepID=A0A2T0WVX4_9BACT|nr:6-bladed beta-propeller [Mongoliibacter ruber]PRY90817.1 6-bladed beta-propeller protein [Mongoliibacter ruber]